jgi:uncharacterized membrane protein
VFYAAIVLILAGHALSVLLDLNLPKIALGFAVIGYLPGALLVRLVFHPEGGLGTFERGVLGLVSSLMLCMALGLLLSLLPNGLNPGVLNVSIWALTLLLLLLDLVANRRRSRHWVPKGSGVLCLQERARSWLPKEGRAVHIIMLVLIALCFAWLAALLMRAENGERFTEFYALTEQGIAGPLPRELTVKHPAELVLGIANRTGTEQVYHIEVVSLGSLLYRSQEFAVRHDSKTQIPVKLSLPEDSAGTKLEIRLYEAGQVDPLHVLLLQITQ